MPPPGKIPCAATANMLNPIFQINIYLPISYHFKVNKYMEKPPFNYPNPLGIYGGKKMVSKYFKLNSCLTTLYFRNKQSSPLRD